MVQGSGRNRETLRLDFEFFGKKLNSFVNDLPPQSHFINIFISN